jgi:hypothetical protein
LPEYFTLELATDELERFKVSPLYNVSIDNAVLDQSAASNGKSLNSTWSSEFYSSENVVFLNPNQLHDRIHPDAGLELENKDPLSESKKINVLANLMFAAKAKKSEPASDSSSYK